MARVTVLMPDAGEPLLNMALICEKSGDHARAVRLFLRACEKLGPRIRELSSSPLYDALRTDPEVVSVLPPETVEQQSLSGNPASPDDARQGDASDE